MSALNFKPVDVIALVIIIGGFCLKYTGANGLISTLLTTVVLFYFGKQEFYDKPKEKTPKNAKAETIEAMVRRIAKEYGVNENLAVRVAKCESGLDPSATNKNSNGSIDRGLFQWNNRWHPEISDKCAFDSEASTIAFCKAVNDGNLSWWDASKTCWGV